jgi:hypothetical protein
MELRRFNATGLTLFQAFLDSCGGANPLPWPESALTDSAYSETVDTGVQLEPRTFATRFDLAEYLYTSFESAGFRAPRADPGLWAWMACFYFNEICPTSGGILKPGSSPRWIPLSTNFQRYYRHLIAGPYQIYCAHRDNPSRALAVLCQKPGRPGDLVEQLASRQWIVTNPTIMQVATEWFVDPTNRRQKKNANSKGPGGPRRLIDVLAQFDVTWDLSMMTPEQLKGHLPREFQSAATASPS